MARLRLNSEREKMLTRNRRERREAVRLKEERLNTLVNYFYNTATSIFSYRVSELSDYLNSLLSRQIEHLLFTEGYCTVFRDSDGLVKVGRVVGQGKLGQYMQFVSWSGLMADGTTVRGLNDTNAVIIYNNKSKVATRMMIENDIRNMIETDISLMQHVKATRVPFVFSGEESDMLTFKSVYESVVEGEGAFFFDSGLKTGVSEGFKSWNTDVEYKGDKLMMLYEAFENRVFSLLGIQSNRIDKSANLTTSEVDKNDDVILVNFNAFKSERQYGCDIAKEIGIDITMEINPYLIKQRGEEPKGEENGKIYNDNSRVE